MDRFARRVVGWAYGKERGVKLTLRALNEGIPQHALFQAAGEAKASRKA